MKHQFFPNTAEELLELLDTAFPPKCPDLKDTEREIFLYAGKRQVVEWLQDLKEHTAEEQLNSIME